VQIPSDTELINFNQWTLRVRKGSGPDAHLLLLLHGWTGNENSMWVFVRNFSKEYWIIAPRAPYASEPSGFSWRALPNGRKGWPRLDDFRPSVSSLITLIGDYSSRNRVDAQQFDVIGFSQGAALANAIALLFPERVRRVGVLSGFLPVGSKALVDKRPLISKPFFVAHGTLDEMVNIEFARLSVALLERAGAQVTYCEDEIGHKLSPNGLRALEEFFDPPQISHPAEGGIRKVPRNSDRD
jgi:phospholipase/carboxylesterase